MCCTTLCSSKNSLNLEKKMGDKDNSVTMEPLLSPTKSAKPKVKAARFQVNFRKLKVTDSLILLNAGGKCRCRGCRGGGSSRSRQ